MINEQLIEKLQKILALATRGATQGEMEAAMARAKEIAMRYGIDLATIPAQEHSKSRVPGIKMAKQAGLKLSTRYMHPYHNWVMVTLEKVFGVKFLFWKSRLGSHPYLSNIMVIGEETDVAITIAMFPWLEDLFPKLFGKAVKVGLVPDRSFARMNGFYMGLSEGLVAVNKREEEKLNPEDRSKWALIVRDKEALVKAAFDEEYKPKKKQQKSRKQYDAAAYWQGERKGRTIRLHQMNGQS